MKKIQFHFLKKTCLIAGKEVNSSENMFVYTKNPLSIQSRQPLMTNVFILNMNSVLWFFTSEPA